MPVGKNYTITFESEPVLDGWGFGDYWGPNDWITWHKALVAKYGLDDANRKFIEAYGEAGLGAASYDWRTFDSDFKAYAQKNGFYQGLFEGLGGLIGKAASVSTTVFNTAADTTSAVVQNTGKTVTSLSKIATWVVPVVVIVVIIMGILFLRARLKSA